MYGNNVIIAVSCETYKPYCYITAAPVVMVYDDVYRGPRWDKRGACMVDMVDKGDVIDINFPNAVRYEKDFFGRRKELEHIEQTFLAGSGCPVVILGERRIGKTSIQKVSARRIEAQQEKDFVPLLLPPAPAIRSLDDYAREILQSLCTRLERSIRSIKYPDMIDDNGRFHLTSIGQFTDTTAQLLEEFPEKTFIICIDELDAILVSCTEDEAEKILGLTEHLIEMSDLRLIVYVTMTRLPGFTRSASRSPGVLEAEIIARSEIIEIGPFSRQETEDMVSGLLGGRVSPDGEAMEHLFELSGGHPYFVKLLLDRLLRRFLPESKPLRVTREMMEQIIPDATRDPRALHSLDNIYRVHFSEEEKRLVLLLSDRRAGISMEELRMLGAPFLKVARSLESRGYLTWGDEEGYNFREELLGWWLRDWEEYEEEFESLDVEGLKRRLDDLEVDVKIERATGQVYLKGRPINLNPQEYQVLSLLCRHIGHIVTRDMIASELCPEASETVSNASIDVIVSRLRRKLNDDARRPRYIKTVTGRGFILIKDKASFV